MSDSQGQHSPAAASDSYADIWNEFIDESMLETGDVRQESKDLQMSIEQDEPETDACHFPAEQHQASLDRPQTLIHENRQNFRKTDQPFTQDYAPTTESFSPPVGQQRGDMSIFRAPAQQPVGSSYNFQFPIRQPVVAPNLFRTPANPFRKSMNDSRDRDDLYRQSLKRNHRLNLQGLFSCSVHGPGCNGHGNDHSNTTLPGMNLDDNQFNQSALNLIPDLNEQPEHNLDSNITLPQNLLGETNEQQDTSFIRVPPLRWVLIQPNAARLAQNTMTNHDEAVRPILTRFAQLCDVYAAHRLQHDNIPSTQSINEITGQAFSRVRSFQRREIEQRLGGRLSDGDNLHIRQWPSWGQRLLATMHAGLVQQELAWTDEEEELERNEKGGLVIRDVEYGRTVLNIIGSCQLEARNWQLEVLALWNEELEKILRDNGALI